MKKSILKATDEWTVKDELYYIVFWHENYVANYGALAKHKVPPLPEGMSTINIAGVLSLRIYSIKELIKRLQKANTSLYNSIVVNKVPRMTYSKGGRTYETADFLEMITRHINTHARQVKKQNNMKAIASTIRKELKKNCDPHTKATGQNFFKEKVKMYGVKSTLVSKIGKVYDKEVLALDKKEVFALCEELWQSGYIEESFIACHYSYSIRKKYEQADFKVFEKWVNRYVSNWASCDTFCNHTVGGFVEMYPKYLENLKKWAKSKNRWMRRASAVTLISPAKHGKFLKNIFEIADILFIDTDDLVQKGYGWMLKAASQAHEKEVFEYVMKHKAKMPRTALRYAIEKIPESLRVKAMVK